MWTPITISKVLTRWSDPETDAARTAVLAEGQEDPLVEIIAEIVREVRSYVATCVKNRLGPAGTIPDELIGDAIARIRFEASTRIPGGPLMDDDRRKANDAAVRKFERAAACGITIEPPAELSTEAIPSSSAVQVVTKSRLQTSRRSLSSL
jgi:hypothetical protein